MKVNINFISDGDIAGVLSVIGKNPKNDIYYSTGGGPEGVLAASACLVLVGKYKENLFKWRGKNSKKTWDKDFKKI